MPPNQYCKTVQTQLVAAAVISFWMTGKSKAEGTCNIKNDDPCALLRRSQLQMIHTVTKRAALN